MYCQNCGKEIAGQASFCSFCGNKAQPVETREDLQKRQAQAVYRAQMAQRFSGSNSTTPRTASTAKKENTVFCMQCGGKIDTTAIFCPICGNKVPDIEPSPSIQQDTAVKEQSVPIQAKRKPSGSCCPKCGSDDIDISLHQENTGGNTFTQTKSNYRQKGHGCLWWLFIGWWWWIVDLMLWIYLFPIRFLFQLFKKKKYVGESTTASSVHNHIRYTSVCLCKNCGYHWTK